MLWGLSLASYVLVQTFGLIIAYCAAALLLYVILRKLHDRHIALLLATFFLGISVFVYAPIGLPHGLQYPFSLVTYGPAEGPAIPFKNVLQFFWNVNRFEKVADIRR
ncbi:MAG: hypothetical protein RIQ56_227, partial [Candidatus Parcubacteria bacterium]